MDNLSRVTVEAVVVGPLEVNAYLVFAPESKRAILVDPGDEAGKIQSRITDCGLSIEAIVLTHGHLDHWAALAVKPEWRTLPVYLHMADRFLIQHAVNRDLAASLGWSMVNLETVSLEPGRVELAGMNIEIVHTPGHSPGSVVLRFANALLTGDTLFAGGIGRSDLPGGDSRTLYASMSLFKQMPPDLSVFPGHGEDSTLSLEARLNPFWS